MVLITEEMVRRRAEHNEMEIFSLEEISLHQQDIERIEYLDKWCKELRILYLQSNLIPKIENVGRLKKLEYLNLALNNIERIENLEGCEFLNKLDLTLNFIGELTSVESLRENLHLKELFLTGNPCTEFVGYRDYVISTLPQLKMLDGTEIKKSDRIKALQNYNNICKKILDSQNSYFKLRAKQKEEFEKKKEESKGEVDDNIWNEKTEYTPESRLQSYLQQEELKKKEEEEKKRKQKDFDVDSYKHSGEKRYFSDDGRPYCCNEPKIDFEFDPDGDEAIVLTVHVYKYLDTSQVQVDVQPTYVRVTLKGKVIQLAFNEEVKPDQSSAKRSQTTGYLVITMPKVNQIIRPKPEKAPDLNSNKKVEKKSPNNYLEVDEKCKNDVDFRNIIENNKENIKKAIRANEKSKVIKERDNSPDFVDNSDVPPLD